jgi:hypothetical protein
MAAPDSSYYRTQEFKKRMDAMFTRDCIFACAFLVWLWATYLFVYFNMIGNEFFSGGTAVFFTLGGAMVCFYNLAGVILLLKHNAEHKEYKYTIDLRHLDAARAAKARQ